MFKERKRGVWKGISIVTEQIQSCRGRLDIFPCDPLRRLRRSESGVFQHREKEKREESMLSILMIEARLLLANIRYHTPTPHW